MARKRAATERFGFTKKKLERLTTAAARRCVYDTHTNGLALAIYPTGSKTFFWFKAVQGKPTWETLGSFPAMAIEQARNAASAKNTALAKWKADEFEGRDPFEKQERLTMDDAIELYVERRLRAESKNFEDAARQARWLRDHYLAAWKPRSLTSIRRKHIIERQYEIRQDHGLYAANRTVQLIRAVYNFMFELEKWEGMNPCTRVKLFHEQKRTRYLQPDELPKFFMAVQTEPSIDLRDFCLIAITTGARRGDILSAKWDEFHFGRSVWTIPNPKNQTPYTVKLSTQAVAVLEDRRRRVNNSQFLFPSDSKAGHILSFTRSWKQLLRRAGIANLRIHDLRRTLASWQATQGSSLLVIGKSLGHTSIEATEVYSQVDDSAVRASVANATKEIFGAGKVPIQKLLEVGRE
jgi:integrase